MTRTKFAMGAAVLLLAAMSQAVAFAQSTLNRAEPSQEEYRVYNSLIDLIQVPKADAHVLIAGKTLDFKCDPDAEGPVRINGCDGMQMPPDTPSQVMQLLQREWKQVDAATLADFKTKNFEGVQLQDNFLTPWKHKLFGGETSSSAISLRDEIAELWERKRPPGADRSDPSKVWDTPDMLFFFSRVGFNLKKTEAIVYVVGLSHIEEVRSNGNYFLFRLDGKKWKPNGRVQYMEANDDGETWNVTQVPATGTPSRP